MLHRYSYCAILVAVGSVCIAGTAKSPVDDYAIAVREILDRDTQHFFRVVSIAKTDQESHLDEGFAKVQFKGEAELVHDAYGRGSGGTSLGLSAYFDKVPTGENRPVGTGVVYAMWKKGAKIPFEGSISWERSDEGWRISPMTMVHQPPFSGTASPDEYVIRCFHRDGIVDHRSPKPYLELPTPNAEECAAAIAAELAKSNFGPFLKAEDVSVTFAAPNGFPGGAGGEYRSASVTFRGVFKVPTVSIGFSGFIAAPVVGEKVGISAREPDFESFGQYFAAGESVQCQTTVSVMREWDYDQWKVDVGGIRIPEIRSAKGVRVKFTQEPQGVVYRTVEVFQR